MNTNRVFSPTAPRFGLVSRSADSRVVLPLKGVQCDFAVQGGLVEVAMMQIFRQENPQALDCDYLFPLPADASVYSCEADVNGRLITARVRERAEAVRLAAEQKAAGSRVMLVESERENLFTLTLSNLQPDDLIVVRLKYVQPLRFLADRPAVEIPFCPGIRYIPGSPLLRTNRGRGTADDTDQVPDASRLSPVRMDKDHPDAAFIEIRGSLDAPFVEAASLVSPSHNIISRADAGVVSIRLSDKGEVPDRDFCLRWLERTPEVVTSRAWIQQRENECYTLLEIRAPKAKTDSAKPMDFYFLVDRSGSMAGVKWQKAVLAVQTCVSALGEADRAMITFFGTRFVDFAEVPLARVQLLGDGKFQTLEQLPLDGGTEMAPALGHVLALSARHSASRSKSVILITDAQVGNEAEILSLLAPATDLPVHCFGIDLALNDALLVGVARQQKGTLHSLNPMDNVAKVVADLAQTIRHPVLTNLQLAGNWEASGAFIPPLYSGQTHYLSARSTGKDRLELTALNGDQSRLTIPLTRETAKGAAPYLHWCKQRIQSHLNQGNPAGAIALSVQSNLICPLTAFIAWDDSEKVAVAQDSLAQPVMGDMEQISKKILRRFVSDGMSRKLSPGARLKESTRASLSAGMGNYFAYPVPREGYTAASGDLHQEMIARITMPSDGSNFMAPPEPYTVAERQTGFTELFQKICLRCRHPEWQPLCDRILAWTFGSPEEAMARSKSIVGLLVLLLNLTRELESIRKTLTEEVAKTGALPVQLPTGHPATRVRQRVGKFHNLLNDSQVNFQVMARRMKSRRGLASNAGLDHLFQLLDQGVAMEMAIQDLLIKFKA